MPPRAAAANLAATDDDDANEHDNNARRPPVRPSEPKKRPQSGQPSGEAALCRPEVHYGAASKLLQVSGAR